MVTAERAAASTQFAAFLLISAHDTGVLPPCNGNNSGLPLVTIEIKVILLFAASKRTGSLRPIFSYELVADTPLIALEFQITVSPGNEIGVSIYRP